MHPIRRAEHRGRTRRRSGLAILGLLTLLLAGTLNGQASAVQATQAGPGGLPPYLADATDPAVTTLASDYGISIQEAQRRIGWQDPALQLGEELRQALGDRFGGLWFHEAGGGRVKVGIVGSSTADARMLIERRGLAAVTDLVPARYSYNYLEAANGQLGEEIARANQGATWGLRNALLVNHDQAELSVELSLPRNQPLTGAQQAVVDAATGRLGAALTKGSWHGQVQKQACETNQFVPGFHCDPPLRAGLALRQTSGLAVGNQCSTAFYAKSKVDDVRYMLTAGHCSPKGIEWSAFQPRTNQFHVVGDMHNSITPGNDDMGIIRINNVPGWDPRPWVYVHASSEPTVKDSSYGINGVSSTGLDVRVCISGGYRATTSCGRVERLNVDGTTDDFGLAQVDYCSQTGDSGSPIYSDHKARGIHIAGDGETQCQNRLYQGVIEAADELNVNVLTL